MIKRHEKGEPLTVIAETMGLNYYTVRKHWRRYRDEGWDGIVPRKMGRPKTGPLSGVDPLIKYKLLRLKRQHPGWGLDKLRLSLQRDPALHGKRLPGRTAMHYYIRQFYPRLYEHRGRRVKSPNSERERAEKAHECWQMDFKGPENLGEVGHVGPLLICDEYSSAQLWSQVYPGSRARPNAVTSDVQAELRGAFTRWGLPQYLRMDRDTIWVGSARLEWPGRLLLWLVGLGVRPVINRPYRPTDNAQVERCGRVWREHVALGTQCDTLADVQALTDAAQADRLSHLPSRNKHCRGKAPLSACPELLMPLRPYSVSREADLFDMQRVYRYLAEWEWERKVDKAGQISLADRNYYVSKQYAKQVVNLCFDANDKHFVVTAMDGTELATLIAPAISAEVIRGLAEGV
jgi:transposase InsO family protein